MQPPGGQRLVNMDHAFKSSNSNQCSAPNKKVNSKNRLLSFQVIIFSLEKVLQMTFLKLVYMNILLPLAWMTSSTSDGAAAAAGILRK